MLRRLPRRHLVLHRPLLLLLLHLLPQHRPLRTLRQHGTLMPCPLLLRRPQLRRLLQQIQVQ